MTAGVEIYNNNGVLLIDENTQIPRFVTSGTVYTNATNYTYSINLSQFGININDEIPIILIRPSAFGHFIGGVGFGNGTLELLPCEITYDYAIFSYNATGIIEADAFGFQVLTSNGSVAYDSRQKHVRILNPMRHIGTSTYPYPYTFSIPNYYSMPWILANPLIISTWGTFDDYTAILMRVDNANQVTVGHNWTSRPNTSVVSEIGLNTGNTQAADPYNDRAGTPGVFSGMDVSFAMANFA